MASKPYEYSLAVQSEGNLNVATYPSTSSSSSPFTISNVQGNVTDGTYSTPLYSWYSSTGAYPQPVTFSSDVNGTLIISTITAEIFGPTGSLQNYANDDISTWVDNPVTFYPQNYAEPVLSNPGPSYGFQLTDISGLMANVWNFNIQTAKPTQDIEISYPIATAYGSCSSSTSNDNSCSSNGISTGGTDLRNWFKINLLNGPQGRTLPFPYVDSSGQTQTVNIETVFATPYSRTYYQNNVFKSNPAGTVPQSGYLVAFYRNSTLPVNTFPLLFDPVNLQNQNAYTQQSTSTNLTSALSWLNSALGTSYSTLNNLFEAGNWLEQTLLPIADGGTSSTGVNLGGDLGEGWYVLGLVPYLLSVSNSNQPQFDWVTTVQDIQNSYQVQQEPTSSTTITTTSSTVTTTTTVSLSNTDPLIYCSGNLSLGSALNPFGTGNSFWATVG